MAFKTRLLATAALPFMAIAGYSLPLQAAMIKPVAEIQAQTSILTVQSEEELQPKKRRNRQAQQDGAEQQVSDPAAAETVQEEPVRKKRKQRQQAEEQQIQSEENPQSEQNAQSEEPVRKNRKQRQQQAEEQQTEEQQLEEVQPSDNAEAQEEPVRRKRQQAQDSTDSGADSVSDDDIVNQGKRKKRQQAEEQQIEEVQPSDNAEAQEEPVRRKRQQAQDSTDSGADAVSDEDIVNQGKRKKRQQAEEQQTDDGQQAQEQQAQEKQAEDGKQNAQSSDEVSDEDIVNMSKDRKKKRDRVEEQTPEAIEKREEIAKDPSKTTDTVVLPVENGAAVLDSDKDADNSGANRERRKRQRERVEEVRVPASDRDAQKIDVDIKIKPVIEIKGAQIDDFRGYRRPEGKIVGKGDDVRVVFDLDGRIVIRSDDRYRLGRDADIRYERLDEGRIKEVVVRPNGDRIVTIRNRWGEIIRRSRIENNDVEIVIFYSPDLERGRDRLYLRDPGDKLPPMRLGIPVEDYIIDVSSNPDRDYVEFLSEPPVEQVERVYSVDEVKYSARLRDKVRRIDLDTITFDTGSAEISRDQASSLRKVAEAIGDILDRNPGETFLIEGHTDAVGSDESNLVLSDERAESVASVLSELFEIPAENLVTQGYGERYLKIETDDDERENRRVTIRRITPLVRPAEVSEN